MAIIPEDLTKNINDLKSPGVKILIWCFVFAILFLTTALIRSYSSKDSRSDRELSRCDRELERCYVDKSRYERESARKDSIINGINIYLSKEKAYYDSLLTTIKYLKQQIK